MIGDSVYDVEAAWRAGLLAIALPRGGFGAGARGAAGARLVLDDVPALIAQTT